MLISQAESYEFLHQLMNMGDLLLCSGAEINRVEDTLRRVAIAYGAHSVDVFVITSSIVISLRFEGGHEITESRRVMYSGGTNLRRMEIINRLSREVCENPLPLAEFKAAIKKARMPVANWRVVLGSALASSGFSVFFGGSLLDGLVAGLVSLLVVFLQEKIGSICPNRISFNAICAFGVGFLVYLLCAVCPFLDSDKIIIGEIMLLIPGIALTNSVRDMLMGDTMSGSLRFMESLLWAVGLVIGMMSSLALVGVIL